MKTYDSEIKNDFDWTYKILKSCKSIEQLKIAEKCFDLWTLKWGFLANDLVYCHMFSHFKCKFENLKIKISNGWCSYIQK